MTLSFKRITSSNNFIPEIDGLRFIAIVSVVLVHINAFLTEKSKYYSGANFSFLKNILVNGSLGVPLFIISGFILGMPFAKHHIQKEKPVNLKNYFLRRLTRLEPPYILVMTVLFFATVFIAKKMSVGQGVESYFSSIFYIHNFVYGKHIFPLLNVVAWSLEIEVQFYILAPLLAFIFSIKSLPARRTFLVFLIFVFTAAQHLVDLPFVSLFDYIQYFFVGFLLVDLYISKSIVLPKTKIDHVIGVVCFMTIWFFNKRNVDSNSQKYICELVQLMAMFLFYYYVLIHKILKILSARIITNIGGMCYSIYLLHYPIISLFGNPLLKYSFPKYAFANLLIFSVLILVVILIISSVFFLLIERPCMDKDWYKKIFKSQKNV